MAGLKLDIGAGRRPHKGYQTIDVEAYANPDFLGDFRGMSFVGVEAIRAHHLLEHFSEAEAVDVLKQWHSWLVPGGQLIVETPDFAGICLNFVHGDQYWLARHAYGDQALPWAFHKSAWYDGKYKSILPKVGFKVLSISFNLSRKILPNIVVVAEKI